MGLRMLTECQVNRLLEPFGMQLDTDQLQKLLTYLELLVRWNEKINLTSVGTPEECVTRHFGESMFLKRWTHLEGKLLDVGSGAGFPGLALRIVFPGLATTLLEPVAKKRAFLKEVARACGFESVEVRPERLEEWVRSGPRGRFETVTVRAVRETPELLRLVSLELKAGGKVFIWTTGSLTTDIVVSRSFGWAEPRAVPLSRDRVVLVGTLGRPTD